MGRLVVTSDATTQAGAGPVDDDVGDRKRPRLQPTTEGIAPGVLAWQVDATGRPPSSAEVDRKLVSMRRAPRERRLARPRNLPAVPVRPAEPESCIWCGVGFVPGQREHICGNSGERRLPKPPTPLGLPIGPPAPESCIWCGLPFVPGEVLHSCGGRGAAENNSDDENL